MTDQLEPTRRSARVSLWVPKNGMSRAEPPTAKHTGPCGQDTPLSAAPPAPAGFGAASSPQALIRPSQRSTSGEEKGAAGAAYAPTAVQVRFRGHETPRKPLKTEPGTTGVD